MSLHQQITSVKKQLCASVTGPLIVASVVVDMAENWDSLQKEADDMKINDFLTHHLGRGKRLAWFQIRHKAVKAIGEHARRTWDHEAAVFVVKNFEGPHLRKLVKEVDQERIRRNGVPLTRSEVNGIANDLFGLRKLPKSRCVNCRRLEADKVLLMSRIASLEALIGIDR